MSLLQNLIERGFKSTTVQLQYENSLSTYMPAVEANFDKFKLFVVAAEPFIMILEIDAAKVEIALPEKILAKLDDPNVRPEEVVELAEFVYEEVVSLIRMSNN